MARAISTRMTASRKSLTCNACPTICASGVITIRRNRAWKRESRNGWKKSGKYKVRRTRVEGRSKAVSHFVRCTSYFLLSQRVVSFQDAAVHHHKDPCLPGPLRRAFVNHAFLHPDDRHPQLDGFIHHLGNKFRAAEDIHDVDLFRYRGE